MLFIALAIKQLDKSIPDAEVQVPGYFIYRNDRGSRDGGGVWLYVRSDLPHRQLDCPLVA